MSSKIDKLKKSKNLTLLEVYNLLCDYNFKYNNTNDKITKKDFKEYNFLCWLYKKLIHNEALQLYYAIKNKIGTAPKIPHNKTRCNNEKFYMYKREKNQANYYYDIFGLDVDYVKRKYVKKNRVKKQKENKIINELTQKELPKVKTLSSLLKENQIYNKLKIIR